MISIRSEISSHIETGSAFYKQVFTKGTPVIIQNLVTIGVSMLDTLMLAKIGEAQVAASSLTNTYINLFHLCCMGLGMGASVLTSRFWGAGKINLMKKIICLMLWLTLGFCILFTLPATICPTRLMHIYTNDAAITQFGARYFIWVFPSFLLTGVSLTLTQVLRSYGKVHVPLRAAVIAFAANIFFNYMFIFGHFGAPRMEMSWRWLFSFRGTNWSPILTDRH